MNLKIMCFGILGIVYSIYLIICGIKMKKHKVCLIYSPYNELYYLGISLPYLISMTFLTEENSVDRIGFFIGITPTIIYLVYIVYGKYHHKKINIYNVNQKAIKKYLSQTLDKYNIVYENEEHKLCSMNAKGQIILIGNYIKIKNYKRLLNCAAIIDDFIKSLDKIDESEKKKDGNVFILGGCAIIIFIVSMSLLIL